MPIRVPDLPPWYFGAGLSLWIVWLVACVYASRRLLLGNARWWVALLALTASSALYGALAALVAEQAVVRTRIAQSRGTFGAGAAAVDRAVGPFLLQAHARLSEGWNREHTVLVTSSGMAWTFDPGLPLACAGVGAGGAALVFGLSCILWAGKRRAPEPEPS